MPGSFNSSQIYACVVGIGVLGARFIVSSEVQGLHKMLSPRGFEPSTSHMLGKHRTPRPRLPVYVYVIITSFLSFLKLFLFKKKQLCAKGNNYAAPDCDTRDSDLVFFFFFYFFYFLIIHKGTFYQWYKNHARTVIRYTGYTCSFRFV